MKTGISIALIMLLSGCSQMSVIEKASESDSHFDDAFYGGKDFYTSDKEIKGERYRVFHQASTGFSGTWGIRRSATKRANEYCKKKGGKKMLTVSEHTASPPYVLGNFPRIEIIFVCINSEK